MRKKKISITCPLQISPVIEESTESRGTYFGFTCMYEDGRFENILVSFNPQNRLQALSAINALYAEKQSQIHRVGKQ